MCGGGGGRGESGVSEPRHWRQLAARLHTSGGYIPARSHTSHGYFISVFLNYVASVISCIFGIFRIHHPNIYESFASFVFLLYNST